MKKSITWITSIGAFIGFMSLVGSPSETETVIGLVIAFFVWLYVCNLLSCSTDIPIQEIKETTKDINIALKSGLNELGTSVKKYNLDVEEKSRMKKIKDKKEELEMKRRESEAIKKELEELSFKYKK